MLREVLLSTKNYWLRTVLVLLTGWVWSFSAQAAPTGLKDSAQENVGSVLEVPNDGILLAQNKKKKRKAPSTRSSGVRKRILTQEARGKKRNSKTEIDFEEASIEGRRRAPAGISITNSKSDLDYDLIRLRLRWHPEMVQSTSYLETGRRGK